MRTPEWVASQHHYPVARIDASAAVGNPAFVVHDKLDWHFDSAVAAGQPPENAFTHIGFYLAWLIRRDLHDPAFIPADHVAAVKAGEMTGSDLADDIDTKLVAHAMNETGRAFSDARYGAYTDEYGELFKDLLEYGVADEPASFERAATLLDRLYAEWVADGRPEAPPASDSDAPYRLGATVMVPPGLTEAELGDVLGAWEGTQVEIVRPPSEAERPHAAPGLEALIPRDLASPPMEIDSVPASAWGSSLLTRALKRLDVRPKDAVVVSAMGGSGEQTLSVFLYGVPGASAERLESEFSSVIFRLPGSKWEPRQIDGKSVSWATGREFTVAYWARDGMVIHVAGEADAVERTVARLP